MSLPGGYRKRPRRALPALSRWSNDLDATVGAVRLISTATVDFLKFVEAEGKSPTGTRKPASHTTEPTERSHGPRLRAPRAARRRTDTEEDRVVVHCTKTSRAPRVRQTARAIRLTGQSSLALSVACRRTSRLTAVFRCSRSESPPRRPTRRPCRGRRRSKMLLRAPWGPAGNWPLRAIRC